MSSRLQLPDEYQAENLPSSAHTLRMHEFFFHLHHTEPWHRCKFVLTTFHSAQLLVATNFHFPKGLHRSMALRRLATKEENLIISCNTLQGNYRPPPTQLVITYYETSHMAICFDHQVVIFRTLKYTKLKLQLEIYFCRV